MTHKDIIVALHKQQDLPYRAFQSSLLPGVDPSGILGVRFPTLRRLAKSFSETDSFLDALPHTYFEENVLHSILISSIKDFHLTVERLDQFLPYVDNWSVCDTLIPKSFENHKLEVLPWVEKWICSPHTYTCRFGIGVLMRYFLKEDFDKSYLETVAQVKSHEYYVQMMVAWYFATALAFVYEDAVPYLEQRKLDAFVHKRTIQKAIESYRVSDAHKAYLKSLR